MSDTTSTAHIAIAFVKAKREFGPALKDKSNPAFRSKYADLGACLEAVDEALLNNGIALYQETFLDEVGVTVETVLLHESGESLRCGKLHVPAAKHDPQGYGSALTYARRYSLMAACGIAPEDDDGNAASGGMPARPAAKPAAKPVAKPAAPEPVTNPTIIATHVSSLEACKTLDALKAVFTDAWRATHAPEVKAAYDKFKTILEATQ